jgi:hypothetical protein
METKLVLWTTACMVFMLGFMYNCMKFINSFITY